MNPNQRDSNNMKGHDSKRTPEMKGQDKMSKDKHVQGMGVGNKNPGMQSQGSGHSKNLDPRNKLK